MLYVLMKNKHVTTPDGDVGKIHSTYIEGVFSSYEIAYAHKEWLPKSADESFEFHAAELDSNIVVHPQVGVVLE